MLNLREYQAKQIFSQYGIPVPRGDVVKSPEDAVRVADALGSPVVLKPQLGVKGRGKVGGIGFAHDLGATASEAERLFGAVIKDEMVEKLLVEEKVAIHQEVYIAVTVDYSARQPVLVASSEGGVDIEETARRHPEKVFRIPINILNGPGADDIAFLSARLGADAARCMEKLYTIFRDYDAELVEINPLVLTKAGDVVAVDAVLNVNEDSLFRQENLGPYMDEILSDDPIAVEASQSDWTYIALEGNIGILSSGAGLTMTILDLIHLAGGRPANFLDTAQIDDEGIYAAFDLLSRAKKVDVLLVNIFAGLNRCDNLALGIRNYVNDHPMDVPLVVRMIGNLEDEGHRILKEMGIAPFSRLEEAVEESVRLSKTGHC